MVYKKKTNLKRLFCKADSKYILPEQGIQKAHHFVMDHKRMLNIATNKGGEAVMTTHSRETKVLVILGVSIIFGAIILNALGHNPPSAGAFCLSRYYRLGSVKKAILSRADQLPGRWSRIEIYYSGTESGNIESAFGRSSDVGGHEHINPVRDTKEKVSNIVNCHFVICNGRVGHDGQIEPTEKWQQQSSIVHCSKQTIRIYVIVDDKAKTPTDFQIKRTEALIEELCRKFNIQPESIRYPADWQ
ncbi:MAG: hypothetical protein WAV28_19050 [Sedimentisphaerales bacterium]